MAEYKINQKAIDKILEVKWNSPAKKRKVCAMIETENGELLEPEVNISLLPNNYHKIENSKNETFPYVYHAEELAVLTALKDYKNCVTVNATSLLRELIQNI